ILQGVIYVFYAMWTLTTFLSCIYFTVITLYMLGTTFNLGVGQAVFRQRAANIWIRGTEWFKVPKKNIKPIIYCMWLVEKIYSLLDFTVMFLKNISFDDDGFSNNLTMDHDIQMSAKDYLQWLDYMYIIVFSTVKAHFFFCLCVMVMSSGSTVVYLCGHMQAYGCKRTARVTVTGILQGVMYVFCSIWTLRIFFSDQFHLVVNRPHAHFTVISLYMSGTTFNLGTGQAVFRQRAADIWIRATQWCRTPTV
uniref:Uncharacterized protein n=1 Tax=Lates calcarifer TaxID=8187 RepID=A0A4W6F467_LATCA